MRDYYDDFKQMLSMMDDNHINIACHDCLYMEESKKLDAMNLTNDEKSAKAKRCARERYLAMAFIMGGDRKRFGLLIQNLQNDYSKGKDY